MIIVYADGGCRGNQKEENIGGWGVVLSHGDYVKELWGGERNTTNNKMELTGVIRALETVRKKDIPVKVYCDSAYVVNGMSSWVSGWVRNNWKKSNGKPVENQELWKRLLELSKEYSDLELIKVKGHSGVELNELADKLANRAMDELE